MDRSGVFLVLSVVVLGSVTVVGAASPPDASFTYSPSTPNPDDEITLDASGSTDNGTITSYEWDGDGDGRFSEYDDDPPDGAQSSITFGSGGTNTVELRVLDNGGKTATTSESITVRNDPPEPAFEYTVSEADALRARFDAAGSSDPDGRIERYEWRVDGEPVADGERPSITFPGKGSYRVTLVAFDNGGERASESTTVEVSQAPTASIELSQTPAARFQPVAFTAANATDPDGRIESVVWTFPEGVQKRGRTVSHSFGATGTYEVAVTLTDDTGTRRTLTRSVPVRIPPEVSVSQSPDSPEDDESITFSATAADPIERYAWDFDGDGAVDATGQTVETTYTEGGEKTVVLSARGANGVTSRLSRTVDVREVPPQASLSWRPGVPRDTQDVVFEATSADDIARYAWDFDGDGETDRRGRTVTHAFPAAGKYVVTLHVEETTGDTATVSEVVTVQQSAAFDLSASQSSVDVGERVVVQFDAANNVNDEPLDVKLRLTLPSAGVTVSGVTGGELVSRRSTNFVTVAPGDSESLQVRVQFNDRGTYAIGGDAVYYFGGNDSTDRREASVGPVNVSVGTTPAGNTPGGSGPGFGPLAALLAVATLLIGRSRI